MAFEQLYNDFFQRADKDALLRFTKEYPYFGPAHFFALQQSNSSDSDYDPLAAKAALHFADPLLLHYQLNKKAGNNEQSFDKAYQPAPVQEETYYEASAAQPIDNPNFESPELDKIQTEPEPVLEEPRLQEQAEAVTEPGEETMKEEPLLFEPLHTTDYFASQGIKLSEVVQTGDKVGRQLRSFTEWLKTMKKLHPEGMNEKNAGSAVIDNAVQHMAERSNKEEEVVTESMAAVYIQQGKLNKAREIYKKLSLLNPSKSAYFAAKLNEIQ